MKFADKWILLIMVLILGCTAPSPKYAEVSSGNVTVYIKQDVVGRGENVVFGIINRGSSTLLLKNSAPWHIEKDEGGSWKGVFYPVALQVIVPLRYNESREWTWNQRVDDKIAEPGSYRVVIADEYKIEFKIL